ncbi:helix-turn-helix domain-containing protein [Mucilaginibacter pedocola]|uniref:Homeodomain phBC6A51-type domain-containing protein n=1 Tax=Mucilaginibacter pedocola TaxID=1792845 RepID=A0A1S9PLF8_9SPHI|nr:helix-turn-helix domain-containing protein [Mucilaginibacter pedocola]OOQ61777.1 hypothetical protein BC343_01530 [Mucilaginibacter pedocola]
MGNSKTLEQRRQFALLLSSGKTQKEAALIIGITEKTAGVWKKTLPSVWYIEQRIEIQRRITDALANKSMTASDIAKLTDAAVKLEKCIKYSNENPLI